MAGVCGKDVLHFCVVSFEMSIVWFAGGCHFCLPSNVCWQEGCVLVFVSGHRKKIHASQPDHFVIPLELKSYETDAA